MNTFAPGPAGPARGCTFFVLIFPACLDFQALALTHRYPPSCPQWLWSEALESCGKAVGEWLYERSGGACQALLVFSPMALSEGAAEKTGGEWSRAVHGFC
ncbi:hypothetical protein QO209_09130 [Pseudomonas citronellolis]|uniref:hypothetical protein n=1 Tax=Pseudomonas citronellolis TaxID=53408 RepID=UPI0011C113FD|nr:hypothetical protein [Pseudomonas citronellolis]MDN6872604.1 hypothetical protein [Pseudomonas citronellolis]